MPWGLLLATSVLYYAAYYNYDDLCAGIGLLWKGSRLAMLIREYTPADLDALRRMHAQQGFDYTFPDLCDPLFLSKLVVEDGAGRPVMASLARLTCEMYLLMAPGEGAGNKGGEGKPPQGLAPCDPARTRFARLLALHRAAERDLFARGLEDAHAWLPPPIAKQFGRRLESLGWIRDDAWTPYCRRLRNP